MTPLKIYCHMGCVCTCLNFSTILAASKRVRARRCLGRPGGAGLNNRRLYPGIISKNSCKMKCYLMKNLLVNKIWKRLWLLLTQIPAAISPYSLLAQSPASEMLFDRTYVQHVDIVDEYAHTSPDKKKNFITLLKWINIPKLRAIKKHTRWRSWSASCCILLRQLYIDNQMW